MAYRPNYILLMFLPSRALRGYVPCDIMVQYDVRNLGLFAWGRSVYAFRSPTMRVRILAWSAYWCTGSGDVV